MRRFVRRIPPKLTSREDWLKLKPHEALEAHLAERWEHLQPNTRKAWKTVVGHLREHLINHTLADLTSEDLAAYQRDRLAEGAARSSLQGEMIILLTAFRRVRPNLNVEIVARRPEEQRQGVALTEEEITRLLKACEHAPDLHLAVHLGLLGMRISEILQLIWGDIDRLDTEQAYLTIRRSKTSAGIRRIPLTREVTALLKRRRDQRWTLPTEADFIFPRRYNVGHRPDVDKLWDRTRRVAALTHVRFHDLRHTAITRLCEAGVPDWTIRAYVGHISEDMLRLYSHPRKVALEQAASALGPKGEEGGTR